MKDFLAISKNWKFSEEVRKTPLAPQQQVFLEKALETFLFKYADLMDVPTATFKAEMVRDKAGTLYKAAKVVKALSDHVKQPGEGDGVETLMNAAKDFISKFGTDLDRYIVHNQPNLQANRLGA